jgi:hypothetical protein
MTELATAFDRAIQAIERAQSAGMLTLGGKPATQQLGKLHADILSHRDECVARGVVDAEWIRGLVRSVADWAPESDVSLLSTLGAIARFRSSAPT